MVRKTRKQRGGRSAENIQKNINEKEQELANLREELNALGLNANDPILAKYRKMLKALIPEERVIQKMKNDGVAFTLESGKFQASSKPAASRPLFSAANLGAAALRKTGGPQTYVANATSNNPKGTKTFAAEIAARGTKLRSVASSLKNEFKELKNSGAAAIGWKKLTDGLEVWFWNPTTGATEWDLPIKPKN